MALAPGPLIGVASGLGMAALGAFTLRLRPRTAASVAFGAFGLVWGIAVVAGNAANLTDGRVATAALIWTFLLLLAALVVPLGVLVLAPPVGALKSVRGAALALSLAAVVPLGMMAASPGAFLDVRGGALVRGPLYDPFVVVTTVLLFALAAAIAVGRGLRAEDPTTRSQLALVSAGLVCYLSSRVPDLLSPFWTPALFASLSPIALGFRALAAAGTFALLVVTLARVLRTRTIPWRALLVAAVVAPLALGSLQLAVAASGVAAASTSALWRVVMVGLFAYALARYRMFDLEVRLGSVAPAAAYALAALLGVGILWAALGATLASTPVLGVASTAGVLLAAAPTARLCRAGVARAAPQLGDPQYLYKRKIDVYRSALAESAGRGMGQATEQLFLSNLRQSLGISDAEHRLLLLLLGSQDKYERRAVRVPVRAGSGKFVVERELGRGTSGRAVLARDTTLDRLVVLKQPLAPWLLDDEGRALFLQEARLAARVRHPNVVSIFEVVPDDDAPAIVMEHVEGGSLEDRLRAGGGRLSADEAVRITRGVLAGLSAIHAAGIVHRDLKPANVLLDRAMTPKVSDFGIARPPKAIAIAATIAGPGSQPGSVAFMSPEQARGDDVDERTDVYAVGAVLYRLLTGTSYLDLSSLSETAARRAIAERAPRLPHPDVPERVARVLERALAKEREKRFASADEMAAALAF